MRIFIFLSVLFFSTFIAVYVGFLILCTICDFTEATTNDNDKPGKFQTLAKFSLWKNAKKLLSTKSRDKDLPFLHGIRVLSTAWIVLFHEYFFQFFMVNANLAYIPEVKFSIEKLCFFLRIILTN